MFDILPWKRNKDNHTKELRRDMESMYDRFFEPDFMPSTYLFGKGKWGPKLDISEGRKDIKVGERKCLEITAPNAGICYWTDSESGTFILPCCFDPQVKIRSVEV